MLLRRHHRLSSSIFCFYDGVLLLRRHHRLSLFIMRDDVLLRLSLFIICCARPAGNDFFCFLKSCTEGGRCVISPIESCYFGIFTFRLVFALRAPFAGQRFRWR